MKLKNFLVLLGIVLFSTSVQAGRVVRDSIDSRVLGEVRHFSIYLPDAFFAQQERHFPILYLLHGLSDDDRAWTQKGQMERVCDLQMASGEAVPMVVVTVEAGGPDIKKHWNGYFNMEGWQFETFFFEEFLPAVEKKYRCGGDKNQRAIAGLSMGGGGSVSYAQRHTDLFSSCYAMSAWLRQDDHLQSRGHLESDRFKILAEAVHNLDCVRFVAEADKERCAELRTVAWFIDCGDDDFLLQQSLELYGQMRLHGIGAQLRVRDGAHTWEYWHTALLQCLPFASRNFSH